jgi:hypothetical protein
MNVTAVQRRRQRNARIERLPRLSIGGGLTRGRSTAIEQLASSNHTCDVWSGNASRTRGSAR